MQSCGVTRTVRPGEWETVLEELAAEGTRANAAANAGTGDSGSIQAAAAKLPSSVATAAGLEAPSPAGLGGIEAYGWGARGQGVAGSVPPAALEQVRHFESEFFGQYPDTAGIILLCRPC